MNLRKTIKCPQITSVIFEKKNFEHSVFFTNFIKYRVVYERTKMRSSGRKQKFYVLNVCQRFSISGEKEEMKNMLIFFRKYID